MNKNAIMVVGALVVLLAQGVSAQQPCDIRGFPYTCYGSVLDIEPETVPIGSTFTIKVKEGSDFNFTSMDLRIVLQPTTATGWGITAIRLTGVQVVDSKTIKVYVPPYESYIGMKAYISVFKYPSREQAESDEVLELTQPSAVSKQGNDYSDAPDNSTAYYTGIIGRFPTLKNTANSKLGRPGAHTLNIGQEMIGTTVSAESDANDPNDEDGVINLVDMDKDDRVFIFIKATSIPAPAAMSFDVSVAKDAPDVTRYVNILIDFNQDGQWEGDINGKEWAVVNMPVRVKPGTTERIQTTWFAWGSSGVLLSPTWIRIALTREPIDASLFGNDGWDGSGEFRYGEIQDHWFAWDGRPPPPPLNMSCAFNTLILAFGGINLFNPAVDVCIDDCKKWFGPDEFCDMNTCTCKKKELSCTDNTDSFWFFGGSKWKPGMVCKDDCPKDYKCAADCICDPIKKKQHTECRNGRCVVVNGPGPDECKRNRDCQRTKCSNGECTLINEKGKDECTWYGDCRSSKCTEGKCEWFNKPGKWECVLDRQCWHYECDEMKCDKRVNEPGKDKCEEDKDCYHKECVNGKCIKVAGKDDNKCETDNECAQRPITPRCGDGYLSTPTTPGGGDEECDPNTGPYNNWTGAKKYPCPEGKVCVDCKCITPEEGYHKECVEGVCIDVAGEGEDVCLTDSACYYYKCVGTECKKINEPGEDSCSSDTDCYHMECVDKACIRVAGKSDSTCQTDNDCKECTSGEYPTSSECSTQCDRTCLINEATSCYFCPSCEDLDMYGTESDCESKKPCNRPDYCVKSTSSSSKNCWYCQGVTCGGSDYPYKDSNCDGNCDSGKGEVCVEYGDSGCYGCKCPDLVVSSRKVSISFSESIDCGGEVCMMECIRAGYIQLKIGNFGKAAAGSSNAHVVLSPSEETWDKSIEALSPGQSSSEKTIDLANSYNGEGSSCETLSWWWSAPTYTVTFTADYGNAVTECDENNNEETSHK